IFVDADACPVKDEVRRVADRHGRVVTFVSNGGLRPSRNPMIRNVVVSKGADAADDWSVGSAAANDIAVPGDMLVADRLSPAGVRSSRNPMIRNVVVSNGADAADDWIVDNAAANDIAVTADVPLAARLVPAGVHVLGPSGRPFTPETIGMAVAMRNLGQHLRE